MTTTPTTKPKRRRARRRKPTVATMNQQQPLKVELPTTLERVERVKPDVQLISREAYWSDFQARMQLHNYELAEAMDDLQSLAKCTN